MQLSRIIMVIWFTSIYFISLIFLPVIAKRRGKLNWKFILVLIFLGPFATILLKTRRKIEVDSLTPNNNSQSINDQAGKNEIKTNLGNQSFFESNYVYEPPQDERKAECPSCHGQLKKVPGARTKCPHCGEPMFVRTDPHSRIRKVVCQAEAEAIDDEIARLNGTYEIKQAEKQRLVDTRNRLREKFHGTEPSDGDVEWAILNEDGIKYGSQKDWIS